MWNYDPPLMGQSLNSVKINTKKQNCNTEQERMSDNVSSMLLLFDYTDLQKEQNTEFFFVFVWMARWYSTADGESAAQASSQSDLTWWDRKDSVHLVYWREFFGKKKEKRKISLQQAFNILWESDELQSPWWRRTLLHMNRTLRNLLVVPGITKKD